MTFSSKKPKLHCPKCYKALSSLTGMDRHKCKPPKQVPQRKRPRLEPLFSAGPAAYEIPVPDMPRELKPIITDVHEYTLIQNGQKEGLCIHDPDTVEDEPVDHEDSPDLQDDLQDECAYRRTNMEDTLRKGSQEGPRSNETSNETSLVTELVYFQDNGDTGCVPGQPVPCEDIESGEIPGLRASIQPEDPWYPFASKHDWDLMSWFARDKASKQSIDDWFRNPLFATSARDLPGAMKSYQDIMRLVYEIPYGIQGIQGNDQWLERSVEIRSQVRGGKPELHIIRYRPIQYCLEFLLGHKPFASDLVWGPVRKSYGLDGDRVYDEMHTGEWWWEIQAELPAGAAVIPIILGTDKTLMTHLRGDRVAWPVYLTIGNLPRWIRRKQKFPATILLGLLPISKDVTKMTDQDMAYTIRSLLYHKAMEVILEPLESLSKTGWNVRCADDEIRHCFPVLSNMLVDYEEVTLIAGIKKNSQCGTCQVPGENMQDISEQWPLRTHQQMKSQMAKQEREKMNSADKNWVHPMKCFAWRHSFVNIHEIISVDILHQLQKGVFRDMINWTMQLVEDLIPSQRASKANKKDNRTFHQSSGLIQLDARFATIPRYPGLKHFNSFSHITQWTGSEENDLVRIIVPVLAPLLTTKAPDALHYIRALVDFMIIANYRTYDESTIGYLEQALYRIERTRGAFAAYRPTDKDGNAHWNTPKFHSLSHYPDFIRRYGAPNGFTTDHMEAPHKFLLKWFYGLTNKNDNWGGQLASHNSRDTNRKAMDHHLLNFFTTTSNIGTEIEAQVTKMTATPIAPKTLGCQDLPWEDISTFHSLKMDKKSTTTAAEGGRALGLKGFIEALAVFVRQSRAELKREKRPDNIRDICEPDSSWVYNYPVQFFGSIRCWRRTGKDETNMEAQEDELLRCTPNWRGRGSRNDFCWVQEFPPTDQRANFASAQEEVLFNPLNGQRVGQLQALIKIVDIGYSDGSSGNTPPSYCAALVDVYPLKNADAEPHPVHGMIEVIRPLVPTVDKPRVLKGRRFYGLSSILRSAHVVPATNNLIQAPNDTFYINNYIDWDQYQVLYEDDWQERGKERARLIKRQHDLEKEKTRA